MTPRSSHWDDSIKRYCFEKITGQAVGNDILKRAETVFAFVFQELNISDPPKIVWIRPARPAQASARLGIGALDWALEERDLHFTRLRDDIKEGYTPGCPDLNEIWIRSDLTAWLHLEFVVAHELRHAWQKSRNSEVFCDEGRSEGDAYPYGYEVLTRYLVERNELTTEAIKYIDETRANTESVFRSTWPDVPFAVIEARPYERAGGS